MKKRILLRLIMGTFRLLCFFIVLNILRQPSQNYADFSQLYILCSGLFYCSLLIFMMLMTRKLVKSAYTFIELRLYMKWAKWILITQSVFLIFIKTELQFKIIGDKVVNPLDLSEIMVPNLGFIVITLLVLYLSALLEETVRLKQENDLMI